MNQKAPLVPGAGMGVIPSRAPHNPISASPIVMAEEVKGPCAPTSTMGRDRASAWPQPCPATAEA